MSNKLISRDRRTSNRLILKRKAAQEKANLKSIEWSQSTNNYTSSSMTMMIDLTNPAHKLLFLYKLGLVPNPKTCPPFIPLRRLLPDHIKWDSRSNQLRIKKAPAVGGGCPIEVDSHDNEDLMVESNNEDHDLDLDLDVLIWPSDCPEILQDILKGSTSSSSAACSSCHSSPSKSSGIDSGYDCDEDEESSPPPECEFDDDDDDISIKICEVMGSDGSRYLYEDLKNLQFEETRIKLFKCGTQLEVVET